VLKLAQKIAGYSGESLSGFLDLSRKVEKGDLENASMLESEIFIKIFFSADFQKVLKMFNQKNDLRNI